MVYTNKQILYKLQGEYDDLDYQYEILKEHIEWFDELQRYHRIYTIDKDKYDNLCWLRNKLRVRRDDIERRINEWKQKTGL